jgi:hypothetical protein
MTAPLLLALALAAPALAAPALAAPAGASPCAGSLRFYGTYSVGPKAGDARVPLDRRLTELRDLGANMIVGTGRKTDLLDRLPDGLLAVPGCGLMAREDWQDGDGGWDEARARRKLAVLAARFGHHPKVYGVCITHEVTEYADHARRVWMYRLAKAYFPAKPVIQYYGLLTDTQNADRKKTNGYGLNGERETDILFVSLPAVAKGHFRGPTDLARLTTALHAATRTPGVPVWGQTSINADNRMVTGPDTMRIVWGAHGENMPVWADALFAASVPAADGSRLGLSGFFWRSLGRFPWDLGFPAFASHRAQMRAIRTKHCPPS